MRWSEEVDLLQEEMRRVLAFLKWNANWWQQQGGDLMHEKDEATRAGMIAYRARQAALRTSLHARFEYLWRNSQVLVASLTAEGEVAIDDLDF